MSESSSLPIPDDIQQSYNSLALRMGDLAFKERELAATLSAIKDTMKTLENERQALLKVLRERSAPDAMATTPAQA